jgi:hypothetical protein
VRQPRLFLNGTVGDRGQPLGPHHPQRGVEQRRTAVDGIWSVSHTGEYPIPDSAMAEEEIVAEVRALLIERHPEWTGQDWIERASAACAPSTPHDPPLGG